MGLTRASFADDPEFRTDLANAVAEDPDLAAQVRYVSGGRGVEELLTHEDFREALERAKAGHPEARGGSRDAEVVMTGHLCWDALAAYREKRKKPPGDPPAEV